ncbi:MAG TPA: hypothetical protein VIA10_05595 [Gaiellaceae bacterium]|jgi:hypothetical protein
MQKLTYTAVAALAAALVAFAPAGFAAAAKDGDGVRKSGRCSTGTTWKLKAKADDGRIETEFEVDQNRIGRRWRVTLQHNGVTVFNGTRTTVAPSGSFEVRRLLAPSAGSTQIVAVAKAVRGGETCRAVITF